MGTGEGVFGGGGRVGYLGGGGREGGTSKCISDAFVAGAKQHRCPGVVRGFKSFIHVFCVCCKLTSCSSMAVVVEAEVSATKRSR